MFRQIDRSTFLIRLLKKSAAALAHHRGLPVLMGIVMVAAAFIISIVNFYVGHWALELTYTILHSGGTLTALIGLLLVTPLGAG